MLRRGQQRSALSKDQCGETPRRGDCRFVAAGTKRPRPTSRPTSDAVRPPVREVAARGRPRAASRALAEFGPEDVLRVNEARLPRAIRPRSFERARGSYRQQSRFSLTRRCMDRHRTAASCLPCSAVCPNLSAKRCAARSPRRAGMRDCAKPRRLTQHDFTAHRLNDQARRVRYGVRRGEQRRDMPNIFAETTASTMLPSRGAP
jgi:hypothetical protein